MKKLPITPASLLSGSAGIQSSAPEQKPRPVLGAPGSKARETERKMQALRLQAAMQKLHFDACDTSLPEDERVISARTLAMTMNEHFETIVWALRVAGGARRP